MPDYNFWNDRWSNGEIGFHLERPHKSLVEHVNLFAGHKTVFVPLCGKSLDMVFLRSLGFLVLGVEFSEIAIKDFMSEHNLKLNKTVVNNFTIYHGHGYKIYQGDLFNLTALDLDKVSACYDRASMVAFNEEERRRYADFLKFKATDISVMLTPLLDYGKFIEAGPPFSVTEEELKSNFSDHFDIKKLSEVQLSPREKFKNVGATFEKEITWQMIRKAL